LEKSCERGAAPGDGRRPSSMCTPRSVAHRRTRASGGAAIYGNRSGRSRSIGTGRVAHTNRRAARRFARQQSLASSRGKRLRCGWGGKTYKPCERRLTEGRSAGRFLASKGSSAPAAVTPGQTADSVQVARTDHPSATEFWTESQGSTY